MGWVSNHVYPFFIDTEETPNNGGTAIATLPNRIGANQNFLACQNVDMTNFVTTPAPEDQFEAGGDAIQTKLRLTVPPFVKFVEFALLVLGDEGETTSRKVTLSCSDIGGSASDTVKSSAIATHDYGVDTHNAHWATTVLFTGGYVDTDSYGAATSRALKVNNSQLDYWVIREVDIVLDTKLVLFSGAYWFVPVSKATVP